MGIRERIVAYCRDNIGASYDTTPSGGVEGESYNCSYLTTCAYAHAGLTIPHWQGAQNGEGSQSDWVRWNNHWTTDPDKLKPGDLVFFGYYDEDRDMYITSHVGISLGGWDMIDSVPDGGVQERTLYGSFVGGGWPLVELPEDEGPLMLSAKGTVRFLFNMNIRSLPSVNSAKRGDLSKGETRNIDGMTLAGDYAWGHYVGSNSGKDCYIALAGEGRQYAEVVE